MARITDRLRGIRRLARKMRDRLRMPDFYTEGEGGNRRHELYEMSEVLIKGIDHLDRLLKEERLKSRRKDGKTAQARKVRRHDQG